jgi:outer membrane protein
MAKGGIMGKKISVGITCILFISLFVFVTASIARAEGDDFKRFGVKVGAMYVIPDESFDNNFKAATQPLVGKTTIDNALSPFLNLEYFFTRNISTELVLTVTKHDIMFANGNVNAGSLWLLPPSLFVKYHPLPTACVSPYVGVGMNVVMPFDEKLTILGQPADFGVDAAVGWAVKFGFDIPIHKTKSFDLYFNADAMYYGTSTQMKIGGAGSFDLDLNPWIVSTGIGIRF